MIRDHGLTGENRRIIASVLRPYCAGISKVGLFGSRATGTYRDNSDVDLVLYGSLQEADIDRIYTLFLESMLPYGVDVKAYHLISNRRLKDHIDEVLLPLDLTPDGLL